MCVDLKERSGFSSWFCLGQAWRRHGGHSNLRSRTRYALASSGHIPRPWRSLSSAWRAPCRWRRHGSRSQGTPSERHESPRRSAQRYASRLHDAQDDGWQAWWCPGCCPGAPFGDAWRLPSRDPYRPCHVQSSLLLLLTEWHARAGFALLYMTSARAWLYTPILKTHICTPKTHYICTKNTQHLNSNTPFTHNTTTTYSHTRKLQ